MHGLKANELNKLMDETPEEDEAPKRKKETRKSAKRNKKEVTEQEDGSSDASVEREEKRSRKAKKKHNDILQQSINGLEPIENQSSDEKEEIVELEVTTSSTTNATTPMNLQIVNPQSTKITKPIVSRGKYLTLNFTVSWKNQNIYKYQLTHQLNRGKDQLVCQSWSIWDNSYLVRILKFIRKHI